MILLGVGLVAILGLLAAIGKSQIESATDNSDSEENQPPDMVSQTQPQDDPTGLGADMTEITTDPQTWPQGDKIWDICRAIAYAEGYNTPHAAFRNNNPGDISDGASTYGYEVADGSRVTKFPDAQTGWNWLYNKIKNHLDGKSTAYPQAMTISEFAHKYAGNWANWQKNVGFHLGVDPLTTSFKDYVG
jgi:hypothetical protein